MAKKYKSRHKGSEIDNAVDKVDNLAAVATTGSYNDLTDKPDIPSGGGADITVDESLSDTSTNPVQNKAIAEALNQKFDKTGGRVDGSILVVPLSVRAIEFLYGECIDKWGNIRLAPNSGLWAVIDGNGNELFKLFNSGGGILSGSIKANDYLDAYGISLYETFATKVGTMAYEDSYIADANSWVTNGWVKTSATTINLPAQSSSKWGTLCTIYENTNNGSKVQIWVPVDGSHKGRMFTRAASDIGFSEWHLLVTSAELGDINAVLDAINGEVI